MFTFLWFSLFVLFIFWVCFLFVFLYFLLFQFYYCLIFSVCVKTLKLQKYISSKLNFSYIETSVQTLWLLSTQDIFGPTCTG